MAVVAAFLLVANTVDPERKSRSVGAALPPAEVTLKGRTPPCPIPPGQISRVFRFGPLRLILVRLVLIQVRFHRVVLLRVVLLELGSAELKVTGSDLHALLCQRIGVPRCAKLRVMFVGHRQSLLQTKLLEPSARRLLVSPAFLVHLLVSIITVVFAAAIKLWSQT